MSLRVVGLSNSKNMFFNEEGIDLNSWQEKILAEQALDYDQFIATVNQYNLRNSIFVDITASEKR